MTIGVGGFVLILVLIIIGYLLGHAAGQAFILHKIHEVCGYEDYRNVLNQLHTDANKED